MASTFFQDYNQNNPIVAAWLNDVNGVTYSPNTGTTKTALQSAAAWVVFSVTAGVVSIQQSNNVNTVVRTSAGLYVITWAVAMVSATNCFSLNSNLAGFQEYTAQTKTSVTVQFSDISNVATDPGSVSVIMFGAA